MKNIFFLIFLGFSSAVYSQVLTEEELTIMIDSAQEKCVGAHESIVRLTNENFGKSIWGIKVRFNEASIVRFFSHPSGEKVSGGVDINSSNKKGWNYSYDQKTTADLLTENGVGVTQSFNTLTIKANQTLLFAETTRDEHKTALELYCPYQNLLELLRTGRTQSIEFLITGYRGSVSSDSKIYGVLTKVHMEKQIIKCSNGHEFDTDVGYKFCPTCGEPVK